MKSIIHFHISKGKKHYVAEGVELAIITQGKTIDELSKNIKEAVNLHLSGTKPEKLGLSKNPTVSANFEIPVHA